MKRIFILAAILILVITGCSSGGGNDDKLQEIINQANLHTRDIGLLQVQYAEIERQLGNTLPAEQGGESLPLTELRNQINILQGKLANVQNQESSIKEMQSQIEYLYKEVDALEATVNRRPVSSNPSETSTGLDITPIVGTVTVPDTIKGKDAVFQLAIRISNTTDKTVSNLDITGTIAFSRTLYSLMSAGYPRVVDGSGLYKYVASFSSYQIINFECYQNNKNQGISIASGASITLRPKVTFRTDQNTISLGTASLNIANITYDILNQ